MWVRVRARCVWELGCPLSVGRSNILGLIVLLAKALFIVLFLPVPLSVSLHVFLYFSLTYFPPLSRFSLPLFVLSNPSQPLVFKVILPPAIRAKLTKLNNTSLSVSHSLSPLLFIFTTSIPFPLPLSLFLLLFPSPPLSLSPLLLYTSSFPLSLSLPLSHLAVSMETAALSGKVKSCQELCGVGSDAIKWQVPYLGMVVMILPHRTGSS